MIKQLTLFLLFILFATPFISFSLDNTYIYNPTNTYVVLPQFENTFTIMNENEQLIHKFYSAFQNKDYETMKTCYHEELIFNDPVFQNLNHNEASKMWEMLIKRGTDTQLGFDNIKAKGNAGSVNWTATYTFNGNKVVNNITANFEFKDGKIVKHTDDFNFQKWLGQALGVMGKLLGWTNFLKNTVRKKAKAGLDEYIAKTK